VNNGNRSQIFFERRKRFLSQIDGGVAVLASAPVSVRSNDVEFVYRQDSDFYYLTGFTEPGSVAVFAPGHKDGEFALFVRPRDKERETWTGRRAGIEGAISDFGADKAFHIDELDRVLPRYFENVERAYYNVLGNNEAINLRMVEIMRHCQALRPRTGVGPTAYLDPREFLHETRLFKRADELALMRKAAAISAEAHRKAMQSARGGMMEWAVEALVDYAFRSKGATGPSYPSIVASGPNATILHYINNDSEIRSGDMLLIDAGCEYQFYASDITRTFPVGSKFSTVQCDLYELVLNAQLAAIEMIKPGVRFEEVHNKALRILVDGMRALKMLTGSADEIVSSAAYRRFFMHGTSHWLGMDVHDVGHYRRNGESRALQPGMVMTVEPGIYVSPEDETVPDQFRGIGIRIEDDVLVTEHGHEVLTVAAPKTIAEVEQLTTST
jgi:Xaa-Pro aminopeptidase